MYQLVYISTAVGRSDPAEVEKILAVSRRNNRRDQITGLLLHDGVRFLQVLEGPQGLVEAAFSRIRNDPRHRATVMLKAHDAPARSFGAWDMACEAVASAGEGPTLAATVDRLVAGAADRNLQAMFRSFARIDRAA